MTDTPHLSLSLPVANSSVAEIMALIEGKHRQIATVRRESTGIVITFESNVPSLSAASLAEQIDRSIAYLTE